MIKLLLTTLLLLNAEPPKTHYLPIGGSKIIQSKNLETIHIQKKGILSLKDEGSSLIFTGKKLGKTTVHVGPTQYIFRVIHKKNFDTLKQIEKWLPGKRGPKIKVKNNIPYVTGKILTMEDFLNLKEHTNESSHFRVSANISPKVKNQISKHVQDLLNANNLSPGEMDTTPYLNLRIHNDTPVSLYKKILNPLGIQVRKEENFFNDKPVIQIKLYIAHVKKSFLRQWGLQWPSQVSAEWVPGNAVQWTNLSLALNALETHGHGKLLATPTLVTESHKKAEFHSGGEFPIRQTTQFSNSLQWKRYGLFLKVTPKANSKKNMQIKIDLELSTLDQTHANSEIPALQRSELKTQINLKKPGPIFLSGLHKTVSSQGRSGLPWLQQIPIFKPLFSTGQIYDDNYELVFILAPSFYE